MNQNICKLAKMYISEDEEKIDNGNDLNFSISRYELLNSKNNNICLAVKNERLKQKYIEKCEKNLSEMDYCNFDEEPTTSNDLKSKYMEFLDYREVHDHFYSYYPDCEFAHI